MAQVSTVGRSEALFERAKDLMPGGVNSPVRAFKAVGGTPLYFSRAKGAYLFDEDGNRYIDFVSSWGAIIHGHADDSVNAAIANAASNGTSFGAPHRGEVLLAEAILARCAAVEMIRFVNSGTEATMSAIRLARAATGRTKIVKFEGNYHGASDGLLAKAGSGVATFALPDSAGVPASTAQETIVVTYNDPAALAEAFAAHPNLIAAVLVEPASGNMGLVPPSSGFLQSTAELCRKNGALLIFDEVMTGFRVAAGGAAELYGITPDLLCYGKVIGGGLPVGAYAGRKDLMTMVAPVGPVYQAGTLSGNPLAMAAGLSAVSRLDAGSYTTLETLGARLQSGLQQALGKAGVVQRVGSMISVFFTDGPVATFEEANRTDRALFGKLFHFLLGRGIYLPPSALESWFLTLSHTEEDIDVTIDAFADGLKAVA